ncbi:hypothetical protein OEZ86_003927 [Tetradesmus obliquus]|nr:hypothetical protein OEZ86_003927 [Tetradesmus obliquus]
MHCEGLTRENVKSHLQKHRQNVREQRLMQHMQQLQEQRSTSGAASPLPLLPHQQADPAAAAATRQKQQQQQQQAAHSKACSRFV